MSSYYLNQSVRGKSIITNVDIEGELNTQHITNQSGSNYDIGSSENTFRTLYVDNISISSSNLQNYILDSFNSTDPINYSQGNISLQYNNSHFGTSNGSLILTTNTTQSLIAPLINTQGSIKLDFDAPIHINEVNNRLDLNLAQTLGSDAQVINKLYVNSENKLDVNLDGLIYAGNGISKKTYLESISDFGFSYIPGIGNIIPDLMYISTSIDSEVLDYKEGGKISIKSQGQNKVAFYSAFKLTSDSTFLYSATTKSLSVDRIVLNDIVDENSENNRAATKRYVDDAHTYASDRPLFYTNDGLTNVWDIHLNELYLSVDTGGNLITTLKGFDGGCISVSPENELTLTYNNKHFGETTAGSLYSKLTTTTSGCLGLTPDYELELNYNTSQFSISNGSLQATLTSVSNGCILIDPSNRIYLDYNTSHFNISSGKLVSTLSVGTTGALSLLNNKIELDYNTSHFNISSGKLNSNLRVGTTGTLTLTAAHVLDLDYNASHFNISSGKLNSSLSTASTSAVLLNSSHQITFGYNSKHFSVLSNQLKSNLTGSGAIIVSDSGSTIDASVNVDTTYLAITTNQITLATGIVQKINKIENIETDHNNTKTKVTTAEGKITSLETRMTTNETKDTTQDGTLTTHTTQIAALQSQVGAALGTGIAGGIVGTVAGVAGGIIGASGSAVSGIGSAALAGITGLGGALLGAGIGILVTRDPNTGETTGNPETFSYEITRGTLTFTNGNFSNLTVNNLLATSISTGSLAFSTLNVTNNTFANILNTNLVSSTSTISNLLSNSLKVTGNAYIGGYLQISSANANSTIDSSIGSIIFGYYSTKTTAGNDVFQVYNNSTDRNLLFKVTTQGISSGSNSVSVNTLLNATSISTGTINGSNLISTTATIQNVVCTNITTSSLNTLQISTGNIISTNMSSGTYSGTTATIGNVVSTSFSAVSSTIPNSRFTNITTTSLNTSQISTSSILATNGIFTNLSVGTLITNTVTNISSATAILTSATISNLLISNNNSTNTSSTNAVLTNTTISNLIVSNNNSTNTSSTNAVLTNTTISNLIVSNNNSTNTSSVNAILTNTTISNLIVSNNNSTNTSSANAVLTNTTISNLIVSNNNSTNITASQLRLSNNSTSGILFGSGPWSRIYDDAQLHIWTDDNMYFDVGGPSTAGNTRMFIGPSGNVGIGTTSANCLLQLSNSVNNRKIVLFEAANNDHQFNGFGINGGILRYQVNNTGDSHVFYAGTGTGSSNELFKITGTGTASITGNAPDLTIKKNDGSGGALYLGNSAHGISRDDNNNVIVYTAGGTGGIALRANGFGGGNQFFVAADGDVRIASNLSVQGTGSLSGYTNWFCNGGGIAAASETKTDYCATFNAWVQFNTGWRLVSDVRIKTNIKEMKSSNDFMNLNPVTYKYIDYRKDYKIQYGLIAQEVQKLYPDSISSKEDFLPDIMSNVKVVTKNSFEYTGEIELKDKLKIYIYPEFPLGQEITKEVNVIKRKGKIYYIDIDIPTDKLFIYGNYTESLLNVNYTNFIPVLIAELQNTNKELLALKAEIELLKNNSRTK